MTNLLFANGMRLKKDKAFWLCAAAMLVFVLAVALNQIGAAAADTDGFVYLLNDYYFGAASFIGLFSAVFVSLFLSVEYSDGAMRNKLVVGHSRKAVYLANLVAASAGSLCLVAVALLAGLVGVPFFGWLALPPAYIACYLAAFALLTVAYAALFTAVAMLCPNKAYSAVLCLLLALALLGVAVALYNALNEPEMYSGVLVTENGTMMSAPEPNPDYVSGMRRAVYMALMQILPSGQSILLASGEMTEPLLPLASSVCIAGVATAFGLWRFGQKDLK